ncbi:flagellar hook protein FlgE [Paraburkholderia nodosa]|uniref:flagellar hook protein FlgE n=1 Tax=Paraburkholderia nodosa TaxID=392320 RepID=UPI000841FFF2|nr:flagellar hook protein FlgE [Paraburkholderia nodosa]
MGYQQALSGLAAASDDLGVIGNNIANANTVGFKQSTAQFADMYANAFATSVNNQVGIGTQLSEVQQNFSNGNITSTGLPLDVAINGNGFFLLSNNGATTYSRNGVFHLDPSGAIENAQGQKLMGYGVDANGNIVRGAIGPIVISNADLPPTATTTIQASYNLNSGDSNVANATFSPSDPSSYTTSQQVNPYDSLGDDQQPVTFYFAKTATGSWNVYGTYGATGTPVGPGANGLLGTVTFNSSGQITSPSPATFAISIPNAADNGATTQNLTLDLTGTTQYGAKDGVTNLALDGNPACQLTGFTVGSDGVLTGTYSSDRYTSTQTRNLGQIVLATFNNPNGLVDLGGNAYAQTNESGAAQISTPGSTTHGTLQGGAVEESNVELTNQLVDLITAQRNYQANAQTIKTQQNVDQALFNL